MEKNISKILQIGLLISLIVMIVGIVLRNSIVMNIGILCLIATPILRVLTSIFTFILEKDKLYVLITSIVLLIIIATVIIALII